MKILFVTAVFLAVAASGVYSQACHMREVDLCMAIGMFHYQSNGVPSDEDKVNEWCETMKEVEECMGNYSAKCLSPLQREVIGLLSGSEDNAKQLCVQGSEVRARYLNHAECVSEGAEGDEFKNNLRDMQVVVEKLFEVPYKQRFSLMCCGFGRLYKDTDDLTERQCGAGAVEMVRGIMKMITTELPTTLCQAYDSQSEECQNVLPKSGTPPKGGQNRSQLAKLLDTVFGNA